MKFQEKCNGFYFNELDSLEEQKFQNIEKVFGKYSIDTSKVYLKKRDREYKFYFDLNSGLNLMFAINENDLSSETCDQLVESYMNANRSNDTLNEISIYNKQSAKFK